MNTILRKIVELILILPQRIIGSFLLINIFENIFNKDFSGNILLEVAIPSFGIQVIAYAFSNDQKFDSVLRQFGLKMIGWLMVSGLFLDMLLTLTKFI